MKLLIVTQAVDQNDPILGFMHRWIEEFAKHAETTEVICLKEGVHALPPSVTVHSLGKERASSFQLLAFSFKKVQYSFRFLSLVWRLRGKYDHVLVHMNPEYMMLAGLYWKLSGKRASLWYNHPQGGFRLRIAAFFANKVFYTSPYAASARLKKSVQMPAGIDNEVFKLDSASRDRHALYMQGRIMPSKRVHVMLEALRLLRSHIPTTLTLVGPEDREYGTFLREKFRDLIDAQAVLFKGSVPNRETPALYRAAGVSVNLAASGHFDKSVLESMACGTPVILSSRAFTGLVPSEWVVPENNPEALALALQKIIELPASAFNALTKHERVVAEKHSLSALALSLMKAL